jgi:uncharacterized integral membrane protein (TIGR00698 family)
MFAPPPASRLTRILPGLLACLVLAAASWALQDIEVRMFGRAWLEALVIAILLGAAARAVWTPGPEWRPGVEFSTKTLLGVAVALLGATVSPAMLLAAGPAMLAGVIVVVLAALALSYGCGRLFGLPRRVALMIACGNAICGNSAIAAVAPVLKAEPDDVAASIAYTAVLGVGVVLGLPLLGEALHLSPYAFGVLAGLTVYAVPQVLAATAPVGLVAMQVGALIKLVRVMMLGPVVIVLSLVMNRRRLTPAADGVRARDLLGPWFILGFLALVLVRALTDLPAPVVQACAAISGLLAVVAMAGLGLGVDVKVLNQAGPRVTAVVTLSLAALGAIAVLLLRVLRLA